MFRVFSLLVTLTSGVATWLVYHALAVRLDSDQPVFAATFLLVSVAFHEIGHMIVMERNGMRTIMFFAVIMGGVMPSGREREKEISWAAHADIALAGCYGNLACVMFCFLLQILRLIDDDQMSRIANLNGSLIFLNLLPLGFLDGGLFAKAFFNSVPEHEDRKFASVMGLAMLQVILLAYLLTKEGYFISAFLIIWGLNRQANCDDPNGCHSPRAIPRNELRHWATTYVLLMCIGLGILCTTQPWVRP